MTDGPALTFVERSTFETVLDNAYVPPGWPTVIPRLAVSDPERCVDFLKEVFGTVGEFKRDRPSELKLGDSLIMVGGVVGRRPTASILYVYVADTDAAFARALSHGATAVEEPGEMPYGDRRAMIEDPWGNRWQIATHRAFKGES
jgi:PhnB protein